MVISSCTQVFLRQKLFPNHKVYAHKGRCSGSDYEGYGVVRENGQRNRAGGILYLTTGAVEIGRSAGGWESGWVVEYWGEGENCIGKDHRLSG